MKKTHYTASVVLHNSAGSATQILNTGDTVAWSVNATGINGCGTLVDEGAFKISSTGGPTSINWSPPRISRSSSEGKLTVFPNPANTYWVFSLNSHTKTPTSITITDFTGKKILTTSFDDPSGVVVPCEHLSKGLYFGNVHYQDGSSESIKLQKE